MSRNWCGFVASRACLRPDVDGGTAGGHDERRHGRRRHDCHQRRHYWRPDRDNQLPRWRDQFPGRDAPQCRWHCDSRGNSSERRNHQCRWECDRRGNNSERRSHQCRWNCDSRKNNTERRNHQCRGDCDSRENNSERRSHQCRGDCDSRGNNRERRQRRCQQGWRCHNERRNATKL
jgi:hypothetical protein